MNGYNHKRIEKKWQEIWVKTNLYKTDEDVTKPKFYALDMFPYPSGEGLHVGHPKGYIATDVYSRMKRMQGYRVLHPMGWDAFGLPAENYAIKNKIHPRIAVEKNIETFKKQLGMLGFSYDWNREINTTDSEYYRWTQWIFLKLFEAGLAYESNEPINWCPSCKTGLANEDLEDGKCERCGSDIERRPIRQWVLKMTAYADKLLEGLDKKDLDWEEQIKEQQKNWIGRSEGAEVLFRAIDAKQKEHDLWVFTTRPDTLFGATFMVLAPEHPLLSEIVTTEQRKDVKKYQKEAQKKSDLERESLEKTKTGVFTGAYAINPVNGVKIPIWISDYVLMGYGHGAIMAVPAHDKRDYEFAKKYDLDIIQVLEGGDIAKEAFIGDGKHINSDYLDGLGKAEAIVRVTEELEKKNLGKKSINYKMRDWVFSRQRYWGEPIPIIHCQKCGAVAVPEKDLPVILPEVEKYEPTGTGESPLANIDEWVNVKCPKCGGAGKRETNTMPQWAGSCWYYLRYIDNKNNKALIDIEKDKNWSPVDLYVGGIEHATRHLLYARFWHKFLYDIGAVSYDEPFKKLIHVGLISGEDGRKMSKRWGNVINPDDVVDKLGADSMRLYEMFMAPFTQGVAWNTAGIKGMRRFLDRVWGIYQGKIVEEDADISVIRITNKTIKKVTEDIENFKFNTAISALMIMVNKIEKNDIQSKLTLEMLLRLLSPFAPHIAEELWEKLGNSGSIHISPWPSYDPNMIDDELFTIAVQINGKIRDQLLINAEATENEVVELAMHSDKVVKNIGDKEVKKTIYVKGKLLSIVVG